MPTPVCEYQIQLREILEREADFLTRQLVTRCPKDKKIAIALFEARVRPQLLDVLEDVSNMNRTNQHGDSGYKQNGVSL